MLFQKVIIVDPIGEVFIVFVLKLLKLCLREIDVELTQDPAELV